MGLFDALMIKDNHIDFCGGVAQALQKTTQYLTNLATPMEVVVECRNQEEIKAALHFACVTRILLDNHSPEELVRAIALIDGRKPTEASGTITEKNLVEFAETGVDFISMGALTYKAKSLDLSLKAL
jgi:nicotinate-nucleotide pyrophosphorylase (carboxylating)